MIKWIRNNNELLLDEFPIRIIDHDNLGIMSVPRIEDSGPLQHGTTDRGFKLPARNIVLYIELLGDSAEHYYEIREELIRWFSPVGEPGTLVFENGGVSKVIQGYPVDGLGFMGSDREFKYQRVPVVIHCPDPVWRSGNYSGLVIHAGGSTDVGVVPTEVPFTVGTSTMHETEAVNYEGTFGCYPESISIYGAITDPVLTNNATGAVLDFTGVTIADGDHYTIELGYGKNRIYDSGGVNQLSKLREGSDITGFKLLPNTTNSITVTGTSVTGMTNVYILWRDQFIGI